MARSSDWNLAKELARPGFTAGQRDIGALVELIVSDEDATVRASPALASLGPVARDAITTRIANAEDGGAARLVATLGLVARAGDRTARAELVARVSDPRVRVRRAAIVALGKVGATRGDKADVAVELREAPRRRSERRAEQRGQVVELRETERRADERREDDTFDDIRAALIARWDAGDVPPDEQRALAEALGKIGGDGVRERLEALDASSDKELERRRDRALLVEGREAKRGEDSSVRTDLAPPFPLIVRLSCRPALGELLIAELRSVGFAGTGVRDDAVDITLDGPWEKLFASRLWASAAIRIEDATLRHARGDRGKVSDAIVKAVVSERVRGLMTAWTRGPIRWRLQLARGHQRAVVWTVAKEVTRRAPELINDPTQTTWDVRVDDDEGVIELVPRRVEDLRFAYRVAEVPAASHPSVAAAVVWLAGVKTGDRVWDPFCGSGVELVEAGRRGVTALIGSDVDEDAITAARANLVAAGVKGDIVRGDARSYGVGTVDAIVTNPPLGSRVHLDAGALLAEALPHFAHRLAPGGRLVWITPQWRRTGPVAEGLGLVLVRSLFVDLGGVRGRLERWDGRR